MKKKVNAISITAGILLLLTGAALLYYFTQRISYNDDIAGGPSSEITITRNDRGVPLIKSDTMDNACYAMGFLHAQDRIPVMEYYRHIADGRISRLIGKRGIMLDRLSLAIGFSSRAVEIEEKLDKSSRGLLESYVSGVNLYRNRQRYDTSPGRDWKVTDVIAILLLKEWANAFLNNREAIFPVRESPKTGLFRAVIPANLIFTYRDENRYNIEAVKNLRSLVEQYVGTFNRGFAFHIPPIKSKKGNPFHGFSFEDDLKLYPGWYPVHINCREISIRGVTFAGMPFIFCGTNGKTAFSSFNCDADTQEIVLEKVRASGNGTQYLSRTGWKNFDSVLVPETVTNGSLSREQVRITENGPLLNDIPGLSPYRTAMVSLRFSLPDESYISALINVSVSDSVYEARKHITGINSLPRTWLFSSGETSITAWSGRLPVRPARGTVFTGAQLPPPGYADLSGFYRVSAQGAISTGSFFGANSPALLRPYLIADDARAQNINNAIAGGIDMTGKMLGNILKNTWSAHAEDFVPVFITTLVNNPVTSARLTRIYLHNWTRAMDSGMVSPSIFQAVLYQYMKETLKDEIPDDVDHLMRNSHLLAPKFHEMVMAGRSPLFDDSSTDNTETREAIFDRAFLKAMRLLSRMQGPIMDKWKWGSFHRGSFLIPLHETSIISRIFYRIKDMPFEGGNSSVTCGLTDKFLRPVRVTSITGYFSDDDSRINMNFSFSVIPMSVFYYGKAAHFDSIPFQRVVEKYKTRISSSAR